MRTRLTPWASMALLGMAATSSAQVFTDNFDDGAGASRWSHGTFAGDAMVNYAYDYGADLGYDGNLIGKPNGSQTTSIGMKFTANDNAPTAIDGAVAYTSGFFHGGGDIIVTFDMFMSYHVAVASTEYALFGFNHTTTDGLYNSLGVVATSGNWMSVSGDGGTARDYRRYQSGTEDTTVANYIGGSQNNSPNAGLAALFPDLDGAGFNAAGTPGNRWVNVRLTREADTNLVTWEMKKTTDVGYTLIYSLIDSANIQNTGRLAFGYVDPFGGSLSTADSFVIYDNINVVPEPATLAALGLGCAAMLRRRRK